MTATDVLQSVQFVTIKGKRFALLSIEDWEILINWLEDIEDIQIVREALQALKKAGGNRLKAGWKKWEEVEKEL